MSNVEPVIKTGDRASAVRRPNPRMPSGTVLYEKIVPALLVLLGLLFVAVIIGVVAGLATGVLTLH
jgi:hypothetical protein